MSHSSDFNSSKLRHRRSNEETYLKPAASLLKAQRSSSSATALQESTSNAPPKYLPYRTLPTIGSVGPGIGSVSPTIGRQCPGSTPTTCGRLPPPSTPTTCGRSEPPPLRSITTESTRRTGEKIVLNEYTIERQVVVPRKLIREDVWERTFIVPDRVVVEEIVEDTQTVFERIVEVATPIIREKIVEVPVYDVIERTVEVPQRVVREKLVEVPRVEIVERIHEVPRIVDQEKIVEFPVVEYRDVPVEKIVEVPEVREKTVLKEVPIPRYIERPVREDKTITVEEERVRLMPIPVQSKTTIEFTLPKIRPVYTSVPVPVYVPRFVEVPMSCEFCDENLLDRATRCSKIVSTTLESAQDQALSLTVLERTADMIRDQDFEAQISSQHVIDNFVRWWKMNRISVDEVSVQSICKSNENDSMVVLEAVSLISRKESEPSGLRAGIDDLQDDVEVPECVATEDGDSSIDNRVIDDESPDIDEDETFEEEPPIEDHMSVPEIEVDATFDKSWDANMVEPRRLTEHTPPATIEGVSTITTQRDDEDESTQNGDDEVITHNVPA